MTTVSTSTWVDAPPHEVFEAFTDLENASNVIGDINRLERLTPGPTAHGTRFRETRTVLGREVTEEMTITDFQPDTDEPHYTVTCESCGTMFEMTFRFRRENGGTRVDITMTTTPQTFMARLLSPLGWLISGTLRKCVDRDAADLKRIIERESLAEPVRQ